MIPTLALDLATLTGWAHSDGASGVIDLKPKRGESPGMRYVNLKSFLNRAYAASPFRLVAYEMPIHRGGAATEVLLGLQTKVQEWCAEKNLSLPEEQTIEYTRRTPKEVKKHATGRGNASKTAMKLAAEKRWGFEPIDDNHTDALWLLDLVQKELGE